MTIFFRLPKRKTELFPDLYYDYYNDYDDYRFVVIFFLFFEGIT